MVVAIGQAAGFAFSFFIPVFLSRRLSIESYGTYKQIILIQWFFFMTLHMGLDFGLFYFMKRHPREAPVFSLNAVISEIGIAFLVAIALYALRYPLAAAFHNQDLAGLASMLGVLIIFTIPAQHLEHYLMVMDKVKYNVLVFSLSEGLKAFAVFIGFYFFHSLAVVILLFALVGALRCGLLIVMNLILMHRRQISLGECFRFLPKQVSYGLPLGVSQIFSIFYKMDRFVIATLFNVRQFTLYSVGSFDIPLVPNVTNTMSDLMSFDMVIAHTRSEFDQVKYLWQTTKRKISLLQLPIAIFLFFFSTQVITFIYSTKYLESAPYFRVFMLIFLVSSFDCDIVFRTFADNRRFLKIQTASSVGGLLMTIGFAYLYGPMGAMIGKLVGDSISVVVKLFLARNLMRLHWSDLFLWKEIVIILEASLISAILAKGAVAQLPNTPAIQVVAGLGCYGLIFVGLSFAFKVIKPDETDYLKFQLKGFWPLLSLRAAKRRRNP